MASLFRPTYTKADPITGRRVSRKVRKWYGKYRDASGRLRCTPLSPIKTAAMAMLTDLVRKIELQKAGLIDPCTDYLMQPTEDHLSDFAKHLEAKMRSERHVSETIRVIKKVVLACRVTVLADLQTAGERLEQHLAERRRAGISHRTINGDLVALRSFCRWLVHRRRMHEDPTRGLERLNQDIDRRRIRRALSDSEIELLFNVTRDSKRVIRRLTGYDRAVLYLVVMRTGLRRGELRSLTSSSFDLSTSMPTVTVEAAKSKRGYFTSLGRDCRHATRILNGTELNCAVWPGSWWRQAPKMLRIDLGDAEIPAIDNNGRIVDFHALRTTFVTSLARAGVWPAMAQRLARHSDINLTLNTYTCIQMSELEEAVGRLPRVSLHSRCG